MKDKIVIIFICALLFLPVAIIVIEQVQTYNCLEEIADEYCNMFNSTVYEATQLNNGNYAFTCFKDRQITDQFMFDKEEIERCKDE